MQKLDQAPQTDMSAALNKAGISVPEATEKPKAKARIIHNTDAKTMSRPNKTAFLHKINLSLAYLQSLKETVMMTSEESFNDTYREREGESHSITFSAELRHRLGIIERDIKLTSKMWEFKQG